MLEWDIREALMRMQVGDSFFIPTLTPMKLRFQVLVLSRKVGIKVTCKEALSVGVYGLRVWRLQDNDEESYEELEESDDLDIDMDETE